MTTFEPWKYHESSDEFRAKELLCVRKLTYANEVKLFDRVMRPEGWSWTEVKEPGTYHLANRRFEKDGDGYKVLSLWSNRDMGRLEPSVDDSCDWVYIRGTQRVCLVYGKQDLEVTSVEPKVQIARLAEDEWALSVYETRINQMPYEDALSEVREYSNGRVNYYFRNSDEKGIENAQGQYDYNNGSFAMSHSLKITTNQDADPEAWDLIVSQKDLDDPDREFININIFEQNNKKDFRAFAIPFRTIELTK